MNKKSKIKPVVLADVTYTDANGRRRELYTVRVKKRYPESEWGGSMTWCGAFDQMTQSFLPDFRTKSPWGWSRAHVKYFLSHTTVKNYERRLLRHVERKLDGAASPAEPALIRRGDRALTPQQKFVGQTPGRYPAATNDAGLARWQPDPFHNT